jgi:hypothetical protein
LIYTYHFSTTDQAWLNVDKGGTTFTINYYYRGMGSHPGETFETGRFAYDKAAHKIYLKDRKTNSGSAGESNPDDAEERDIETFKYEPGEYFFEKATRMLISEGVLEEPGGVVEEQPAEIDAAAPAQ